jgi:predicted RND superfamily exporter protein
MVAIHRPDGVYDPITLGAVRELSRRFRALTLNDESDAEHLAALARQCPPTSPAAEMIAQALIAGLEPADHKTLAILRDLALRDQLFNPTERNFLTFLVERIAPVRDLASFSDTENILGRDGTLVVRPSLRPQAEANEGERIRHEVEANPMLINGVVSKAGDVALLVVEISIRQDDAEGQLRAFRKINDIIADYRTEVPAFTSPVHVAGVPAFVAEQKRIMDADMGLLFPTVLVVVMILLWVFFRRPLGMLLPMLNVIISVIWTLGLMALTKVPMDLITSVLPVFLIALCSADAIHVMFEYYRLERSGRLSSVELVRRTMREMTSPVILTTVTTSVAFIVETMTDLTSIRNFGLFMAVGLWSAQVVSLLLIPAWLTLVRPKAPKPSNDAAPAAIAEEIAVTHGLITRLVKQIIRHRLAASAVLIGLLTCAVLLIPRIIVDDAGSQYFRASNTFRQADEFINEHIAGTSPVWIRVTGTGPEAMYQPEVLAFVDRLDRYICDQDNVTYSYSLPKYIQRMNVALNDGDSASNILPNGPTATAMVRQIVFLYENGGGSQINTVINADASATVIMATMATTRASDYRRFLMAVDAWTKANVPPGLSVSVAGTPRIWDAAMNALVGGQWIGVTVGLLAIASILMLWLRSIRLGILTAIPLIATVLTFFGFIGLTGIELNIGTGIVSFLVIGIVDYAVHFTMRIKREIHNGLGIEAALIAAAETSGRSIAFNVAIFSCGFLTLTLSEFSPIVYLGFLVATSLALSGFMTIVCITITAPWLLRQESRRPAGA